MLLTHRERREQAGCAVWIEAPLLDGERLLGTVRFFSLQSDSAREFTARERGLVELLAGTMARSTLLRRLERAGMLSELLEHDRAQAMQLLSRSAPLEEILLHVTRMIERQRPEMQAAVLLLEEGRLRAAAAPGLPDEYRQALAGAALQSAPRLAELAEGQAGWALLNTTEMPPFATAPGLAARLGVQQALVERVALDRGCALGFLALHGPAGQLKAEEDLGLLGIAAPLVAIALDRHEMHGRLEYQSQHDALTGLLRHGAFQREVAAAVERRDAGRLAAVLVLDLDRFRQVNDSLGLAAGDKALAEIARRIREAAPPGSVAARSGGDEFALLLTDLETEAEALAAAEVILRCLRLPVRAGEHDLLLTASAGLSVSPQDGDDAGLLLRRAAAAMLRVKGRGKNDLQQFHAAMGEAAAGQVRLETALRQALQHDELSLRFQPQFYLDGRLDGFEVLSAWRHPEFGQVAPARFIPIAEEIGMIGELGRWVLRRACREAAGWRQRGCAPVRIAVNVSPLQFAQPDFLETVSDTLREAGLDGSALELEITESVILRDFDEAARSMARLRALGVTISIDDFGVGYSSLNYLRQLPLDAVKIDRSFVQQLTKPNGSLPLIHTITILAHNLGLKVIAEGVEQTAEMRMLELARCDKVQGFLWGEPIDAGEVLRRLTAPGGYPLPECARQKTPGW
jgi:diguanylate cyclase (GGDEF)-like protein